MTGTRRYQSHFSLPSPTSSTPALFPSSAPPRWLQYCGPPPPVALPQPFRRHSVLGFRGCISISPGVSSERSIATGPDNKRVGLGWAQQKIIRSWTSLLACYPSFSPPTLMQGPRRPPTADELLQVPLHETKGNPPILLVRIRDTPPPKMAVCDRAAQLIRTRPRDTHRLPALHRPSGGLHPAPASPRAAQRRRTTPGRADPLGTKSRANTFGKENHLNQLVAQPSREAIGVLVLMLASAISRLVLHVHCCSLMLTTSLGDSRVDSPVGLLQFLVASKTSANGTCFKFFKERASSP